MSDPLETLRQYQQWRRGGEGPMLDPIDIGLAIDAVMAEVEQSRAGEPTHRQLQRQGKHPAPCQRHCEATAFEVEIRRLKAMLRDALPHVAASAEASHLMDGFRPKPKNALDSLAHRIEMEVRP